MIAVLGDGGAQDEVACALGRGLGETGAVVVLGALGTTADEVDETLGRAEAASGPLTGVVLVSAGTAATRRGDLAGLDPRQWRERVELPLKRTLACFGGAHRRLRARGGGLVILVPTLALVGAAGFGAWATVAEGQRALAKSAARAWGPEGITVNCVAVPGVLLAPRAAEESVDRPGQPAPALGHPDLDHDVAPVVAALVSERGKVVTGATVAVDGGVWMTP